jgi:uncharacterized protein YaiE (UPF0345 family)
MAYIGNTQLNQNYVPAVDFFSGNASTTAFTLSRPVASVAAIQAVISNVPQDPGTAYTVSGNTITFTSAPPSGTNNVYVYYTSPNTQVVALPQSPTILGTTTFGNSLSYGASGLLASFASNTNGYNQVVLQNASSGSSASSDLIVSNNSGTDSTNYGDFGINGSGYSGSGPFSTAGGVYAYAQTGSMSVGTVGAQPLVFGTSNTEQMRVNAGAPILCLSGGNTAATGTGIAFPATQSASSDANTLDDYEEGTWTPAVTFGGGSTGITYSAQLGNYTKIGRIVHVQFRINMSNKGSSTGSAAVAGLPFTSGGTYNFGYIIHDTFTGISAGYGIYWSVENGASSGTLRQIGGNGSSPLDQTVFQNTSFLSGFLVYEV